VKQDTPIVWRGHGEGNRLLSVNLFRYKDDVVPVWVHRGFERSVYRLTVSVDVCARTPEGRDYRTRTAFCYLDQPLTTTRPEHVDVLVAMCDLISLYNGVECAIVGGDTRLRKMMKPKRRR
jgi:hypothetical protein